MLKKWNDSMEKLFFQSENTDLSFEEIKNSFELNLDNHSLQNLSYVFSSQLQINQITFLFSQLSSFFEVGFLLQKNPQQQKFKLMQIFAYSKHLTQLNEEQKISLPHCSQNQILSTPAQSFLKKFNLGFLDDQRQLKAFLVPLNENNSLIVMSGLAEPWLQLRIECLQNTLMKIDFQT